MTTIASLIAFFATVGLVQCIIYIADAIKKAHFINDEKDLDV
jgi:hypothetical protein